MEIFIGKSIIKKKNKHLNKNRKKTMLIKHKN